MIETATSCMDGILQDFRGKNRVKTAAGPGNSDPPRAIWPAGACPAGFEGYLGGMKKFVALLGALAVAALLTGQTTSTPAAQNPPAKPAAPAKPVEKEEPKIPGIVLQRPGGAGNQLGLTISNGTFKLSFYDKKRKPIAADVTRARANWQSKVRALPDQTMLNVLDGGKALGGGKPVRPPYAFVLHLSLLSSDDSGKEVEHYDVQVQEAALNQK
jgi:hypothetical protein